MKILLITAVVVLNISSAHAQLGGLLEKAKLKTKNKIDQKIDQKMDKTIDNAIDPTVSGDKKKKNADNKKTTNTNEEINSKTNTTPGTPTLKSYGKFDFVPGEKIIAYDDFSNTNIGDFPANWNTNSGGDLVNVEGKTGKWLTINKAGLFMPEYITKLPENFTFEFEIICNPEFSFYSSSFDINFGALKNPSKDYQLWKKYSHAAEGVKVAIHPTNAGFFAGTADYFVYSKNEEVMKNQVGTSQFFSKKTNYAKVSIWRQKQRLRVYLNEDKVLDVPRAFDAAISYNSIVFGTGSFHKEADKYLIGNIRLAVGDPDTRNKLLNEGKFVTHGILFDVNSDKIKPESYGTLKEIATVLSENASVNVKIVGHTDSDGEDDANMVLSKKRAESVKNALSTQFNIEASRMTTDGKGKSMPVDKNTSAAGKANNRRVEFIKQ